MNRFLGILLILMGIAELAIALANLQTPLPVSLVLGALFIGMGIKSLLVAARKK